jgi:mono/diheme cytochrome c family protein
MPRQRPQVPAFESTSLDRSLNRYLAWGIVFMLLLLAGFVVYRIREPGLRRDATRAQTTNYTDIGRALFAANCAQCHGHDAAGGGSAPTLNSTQFLKNTTDDQIHALVSGGVSGTAMPAWSVDYGGTFTDEQIRQVITFLRSLEPKAPSVPTWRQGTKAPA